MNQQNDEKEAELISDAGRTNVLMWITTAVGALIALIVVLLYKSHFGSIEDTHERWGQFGDYFGGVLNPIFSFLGLVAILVTLRLQISQTRQSLKDTVRQNKRADLIQFQTTFFQLVALHNNIMTDAAVPTGLGTTLRGRDAYRLLQARIESIRRRNSAKNDEGLEIYQLVYLRNEDLLAHYFRNMYHIIKFIDMNDLADRQYYADLLRAQLSSSEAVLLFYNGLSRWGQKKAKPLIEKYGLLKTLPTNVDLPDKLLAQYDQSAFRKDFMSERSALQKSGIKGLKFS
jgi:uncharacterized membrane protein